MERLAALPAVPWPETSDCVCLYLIILPVFSGAKEECGPGRENAERCIMLNAVEDTSRAIASATADHFN